MEKVCRDFMERRCSRKNCRFIHDKHLCYNFWKFNNCKFGKDCRKNHFVKIKNTESFAPHYAPADMRVLVENGKQKCEQQLQVRDVILVPDIFQQARGNEIYDRLVAEATQFGDIFKLWHGDTHLIADDKLGWKDNCPTFKMVIDRIGEYFGMNIAATRFNWYKDQSQHKPFHFDAAGVKPEKAKTQNFTVGVSFGCTRDIAFEEVDGKKVVSIPCPDGFTYGFCRDMNTKWRHGIPAIVPEKQEQKGRISVIAWGWKDQLDV